MLCGHMNPERVLEDLGPHTYRLTILERVNKHIKAHVNLRTYGENSVQDELNKRYATIAVCEDDGFRKGLDPSLRAVTVILRNHLTRQHLPASGSGPCTNTARSARRLLA